MFERSITSGNWFLPEQREREREKKKIRKQQVEEEESMAEYGRRQKTNMKLPSRERAPNCR